MDRRRRIRIRQIWEHYLEKEIRIEFKACLYFFCILFFYSMYRLLGGSLEAGIPHMAEMILLCYAVGYLQVYLLSDFDEGESLGCRELCYAVLCSLIYTGSAWLFGWFDRKIKAGAVFEAYMLLVYSCTYLVNYSRHRLDEKMLNEDLKAFKERRKDEEGSGDR